MPVMWESVQRCWYKAKIELVRKEKSRKISPAAEQRSDPPLTQMKECPARSSHIFEVRRVTDNDSNQAKAQLKYLSRRGSEGPEGLFAGTGLWQEKRGQRSVP